MRYEPHSYDLGLICTMSLLILVVMVHCISWESKKDNKDQKSIQSSTTPVPGYRMESNKIKSNITNKS